MAQISVFVTGGSRGIGRAVALRFAREGAKVVVAARSSDALDAVVLEIVAAGGEGLAAQLDVTDHGSVEAAVYRAMQFTEDTLDVLVNAAGVFRADPVDRLELGVWGHHVAVNLSGALMVTQEVLPGLKESARAHVFNVCGLAAGARPGHVAFAASKQGLRGLGDALRLDLAEQDIRVTSVFPPPTESRGHAGIGGDGAALAAPETVADAIWRAYQAREPNELIVSG